MLIRVGLDPKTASPSRSDAVKNETVSKALQSFFIIYIYQYIYPLVMTNIAMENTRGYVNNEMLIRVGLDPKTASPSRSDAVKNETVSKALQSFFIIYIYQYIYPLAI